MGWLDKLERKYGKYAIPNLMYYVIMLYVVGYVLEIMQPELYGSLLCLDAEAILHGQIWRIFTFIIQPPSANLMFMLLALYLYYMIGNSLEYAWGAFRFNLYLFSGVILHVAACLLVYAVTGVNLAMGTTYLNLSLFLVFTYLFPDMEFLLFFIIPIKAKWLGIIEGIVYGVAIVGGLLAFLPGPAVLYLIRMGIYPDPAGGLAAFVSLLNLIIFMVGSQKNRFSSKTGKRRRSYKKKVRAARGGSHHRCAVCGRTEQDGEELEFRFCSKCAGNYEYCQDHLFTHEHRK
ncbi:MAG: hypothetical protein Q4C82_02335 [Eubacteriales bacterium]|nr:hypothetical protein [Eubacteriales bacterium]